MQTRIIGTTLPALEITLEPGEKVISEPGELSWMTENMTLHTTTATGGSTSIWGAVKRALGGGGLFMTEFSPRGSSGMVAFAAKIPGTILPIELHPGREYMVHSHGFLCGTESVELSIGFQRTLGAGIFGGEGLILQKIGGTGTAWISLGGETVTYDLGTGEVLKVHPGHVGAFEAGVQFDITMVQGIRNIFFGGDGLFLAQLTGPGKVWLQTLTMPNLAHSLLPYLVTDARTDGAATSVATVAGAGIAGALIEGLLKGGAREG